jgi:hypothetical protein
MEKSSQSKKLKNVHFFNFVFSFVLFSVQDFLDSAKKDFEDRWSKNDKVRHERHFFLFCFDRRTVIPRVTSTTTTMLHA